MKQNNLPRDQYIELEQLPNIGPSIADDLRGIGIRRPSLRACDRILAFSTSSSPSWIS
jgi:hypothetical protein